MAEPANIAFGRYLRVLRERRRLSLEDVATLSRTFADSFERGYLSKCENGKQSLALSKMIALSRIYEIPAEVLVERLELDLELDRVGGPVTENKSFAELTNLGTAASRKGMRWDCYGYMRDATERAASNGLMDGFHSLQDQVLCAWMNYSTAVADLGRTALALHELLRVKGVGELSLEYGALLLERISLCYRRQSRFDLALEYADAAIERGRAAGSTRYLGVLLGSRANLASRQRDYETALRLYQEAYQLSLDSGRESDCATLLLNIAETYVRLGRLKASRRALTAANRASEKIGQRRTQALGLVLLGRIEDLEGSTQRAAETWRRAMEVAGDLKDKVLRFEAEFCLFKQASRLGDAATAKLLESRLRKLLPWMPEDRDDVVEFRDIYQAGRRTPRKWVAAPRRS